MALGHVVKNALAEERKAQAAADAAQAAAAAGSQQEQKLNTTPMPNPAYTEFTGIETPAFGSPLKPMTYDMTQNDSPNQVTGLGTPNSLLSPPPRTADTTPKVIQCPGSHRLYPTESNPNFCSLCGTALLGTGPAST